MHVTVDYLGYYSQPIAMQGVKSEIVVPVIELLALTRPGFSEVGNVAGGVEERIERLPWATPCENSDD